MHQPRDIAHLPLPHRALLACTFAACLYLHLSYFFWSMCALYVVTRGDTVESWVPPFNRPFAACSSVRAPAERVVLKGRWRGGERRLLAAPFAACSSSSGVFK